MTIVQKMRRWKPAVEYVDCLRGHESDPMQAMAQLWAVCDATARVRANVGSVCVALGSGFVAAFLGAVFKMAEGPEKTEILISAIVAFVTLLAGVWLLLFACEMFEITRKLPDHYAFTVRRYWLEKGEG